MGIIEELKTEKSFWCDLCRTRHKGTRPSDGDRPTLDPALQKEIEQRLFHADVILDQLETNIENRYKAIEFKLDWLLGETSFLTQLGNAYGLPEDALFSEWSDGVWAVSVMGRSTCVMWVLKVHHSTFDEVEDDDTPILRLPEVTGFKNKIKENLEKLMDKSQYFTKLPPLDECVAEEQMSPLRMAMFRQVSALDRMEKILALLAERTAPVRRIYPSNPGDGKPEVVHRSEVVAAVDNNTDRIEKFHNLISQIIDELEV